MRKTTISLMISALLVSGAAVAGGDKGKQHGMEMKGQAASESRLSIGSVRTMGSATAFAKLDANADKVISRTEANAMQGLPQQFGKLDANADGRLTVQEFASLSANSSGTHGESAPEVAVDAGTAIGLGTNAEPGRQDDPARNRTRGTVESESEATASLKVEDISRTNAVQAFNNVDADGNFKLDKREAARIKGLEKKFADLDRDGDGVLDYAEFNAVTSIKTQKR